MNATTKRGGKYILSELLEATQSHQVSTKHDETTGILHVVNSEVETKKDHVTHEENKKDKKRKLKTKSENYFTETQLQGQMSLILLDEVKFYNFSVKSCEKVSISVNESQNCPRFYKILNPIYRF